MSFETNIKKSAELYLADPRTPNIPGFVDQLFCVAAEAGSVAGEFDGDNKLRFHVSAVSHNESSPAPSAVAVPVACVVEHAAGRSVLRMICARLGVICNENSHSNVSLYGDNAVIEYPIPCHKNWSISFTNTPECQQFVIEAL